MLKDEVLWGLREAEVRCITMMSIVGWDYLDHAWRRWEVGQPWKDVRRARYDIAVRGAEERGISCRDYRATQKRE